ncbi:glycosyl hydrolase 53 family protein [Sorangium sp. So ce136]|uniref:glycosyl hydrolase 53 family protein n=1 Tax=Sorangium sp. So ce136 TaxID=3133284 RepID=UPI003F07ECD0
MLRQRSSVFGVTALLTALIACGGGSGAGAAGDGGAGQAAATGADATGARASGAGATGGDPPASAGGGGAAAGGGTGGGAGGAGAGSGAGGSGGAAPGAPEGFILGADISWVQEREAGGKVFRDVDPLTGQLVERDILEILKAHGFNWIRLRLFNDPTAIYADPAVDDDPYSREGFCGLARTIEMAQRVKRANMGLLLDLHYSDVWADPDDQHKPVAWTELEGEALASAVREFTRDTIEQLSAAGARPDMVQIGNEIPQGLLWPDGFVTGRAFEGLGSLLKAGTQGVKDVDEAITIMLHLDRCNDNAATRWWVDGVLGQGVEFDVLGQSCYTEYQGPPSEWQENFDDLVTRYPALKFVVAEYSWEKRAANDLMFNIPDRRGLGTFIWEPTEYHERIFEPDGDIIEAMIAPYDQMKVDYRDF